MDNSQIHLGLIVAKVRTVNLLDVSRGVEQVPDFGEPISIWLTDLSKESLGTTSELIIRDDDSHNALFTAATNLLSRHMLLDGQTTEIGTLKKEDVVRSIGQLDAVTNYNPGNWAAFWFKGKGFQVLGHYEDAYREFAAAFDIQKGNPDVAREYASSCLEIGRATEAVKALRHATALSPSDGGLHANLALALLLNGQAEAAKQTIEYSLQLRPSDKISRNVQATIEAVITGQIAQPKTIRDLEKR